MSSMISKTAGRFSETSIDGEIVVMNLDSGEFFSLTETGKDIWELIDGQRSRDGIIAELAEAYSADFTDIAADVDSFLTELREAGLVEPG